MAERVRTVAVAGLGSVGRVIAARLLDGLPGYSLSAVSARRPDRAAKFLAPWSSPAAIVPIDEVAHHADIVVECAPPALFRRIAEPAVRLGRTLIALSAGALLDSWGLVSEAERSGARIMVPTGALLALDAVQAVAQGSVRSVNMVTRKPVAALENPHTTLDPGVELSSASRPVRLFAGTVREGIKRFPTNVNVAVALSLAGIGPDRTQLEVWADPGLHHNTHHVTVDSDSARLDFSIQNVPSENPASGRLTPLSVIALLKKLRGPLSVGT